MILLDMNDDIFDTIACSLCEQSTFNGLRDLAALVLVSTRFRSLRSSRIMERALREASGELLCSARMYAEPPKTTASGYAEASVIDLSSQRLGTMECAVLGCAIADGLLPHCKTLWLQNNKINGQGLRLIADALRRMPPHCKLRAVSLGGNAFAAPHLVWLRGELKELEAAAARRRISLRIWS